MTLASAVLLTLTPSVLAHAQGGPTPAPQDSSITTAASPSWSVVTADAVNVRSGPSAQSSYAIGKLRQGDLVRMLQNEYGWARVQTCGGAFAEMYAYVPADRRIAMGADGTTARVNARTELRAANADAGGAPDKSWKQIGHLDPGATLTVLGIVDGEKESVYKVRIPESAQGWVNMQFLRAATPVEATAAVESPTAKPATRVPAAPAAPAAAPTQPSTTAAITEPALTGETVAIHTAATANAPASGMETPASTAASDGQSPSIPPLLGQSGAAAAKTAATSTTTATGADGSVTTTRDTGLIVERSGDTTRSTRTVTVRRTTIGDLEQQFKAVRKQPEAGAEFAALQAKYEELASEAQTNSNAKAIANARAQQLGLLIQAQTQMQYISSQVARNEANRQEISKRIEDMQRRADYAAVGVLNASAVYDGRQLPELYRVCDPMTGATIAYVLPNPTIPMSTMLTTLVGVKGGSEYDPALRLRVISPLVVEMIIRRDTPQVSRVEQTQPAGALAQPVVAPVRTEAAPLVAPVQATDPAATPAPDAEPCPEEFEREVPASTTP